MTEQQIQAEFEKWQHETESLDCFTPLSEAFHAAAKLFKDRLKEAGEVIGFYAKYCNYGRKASSYIEKWKVE